MYGYVTPLKESLTMADFSLYKAFYCGICKATGKMYGQLPRFTTNYDIVFLSVILHDFTMQQVEFECKGCIGNPFVKKTTVIRNELLDKIVNTNIILSYYKMIDAVKDKEGPLKKVSRAMLKHPYKKAKKHMPGIDEIVKKRYNQLFEMEKQNFVGIDRVSDCFASLLKEVAKELLGTQTDDNLLGMCYNVGKFVYLADALDDIDEDFAKKRYNPFLVLYKDYENRKQFLEAHKENLTFIMASTINRAIECFNQIIFTQSHHLILNIVHEGLRAKVEQIFASVEKLPKPKI